MGATGVRMRFDQGSGSVSGHYPKGGLSGFSGGIYSVTPKGDGVRAERESADPDSNKGH